MCLLTISVKNTRPEVVKLAKIAKYSGFSRLVLVRARTFERKVIETSEILENDFGGVGACSCSLNTCFFLLYGAGASARFSRNEPDMNGLGV